MFTDVLLFKLPKCRKWYNFITIVLLFILIAISYLHGEAYTHCNSIYPDEIMDLQGPIFQSHSRIKEYICLESKDNNKFITSFSIELFYINSFCIANDSLFIKHSHLKDFKKRLFMLQHYNS